MDFKISSVKIECNRGSILIPFSDDITFFYGNTGVGKTTMLNLINYALGQDLILTQIIVDEVKSVCLETFICGRRLSIERRIMSNLITVREEDRVKSFLAKVGTGSRVSFSDFLYKLENLKPIEMLRGRSSKSVRVSFANFMWYAYLRQDELDNTFFYLGDKSGNFKKYASTYVLHVILDGSTIRENGISQEFYRITEKQEALQTKLIIMQEIFSSSKIFELNIGNEIAKKYQLLGDLNQKIEELMKSENPQNYEKQIQKVIMYSKTIGKYEAEIRYLQEFGKISSIQKRYEALMSEYEQEKQQYLNLMKGDQSKLFLDNISCLQDLFKGTLLSVGFPGISCEDIILINTNSFVPAVYSTVGKFRFDYYNLSSSGIRTIFKICYALSIYRFVKLKNISTLLPNFIMIDTPMKNISERLDKKIFIKLYEYFYYLFSKGGDLYGVQLIIIDKEAPEIFKAHGISCRIFTKEEPLIPLHMLK